MKRNILRLAGLLLLAMTCFTACGDDEVLTPSGNDTNQFAPADDDHSPVAELRRSFYNETGIYLLFTDTLRHVQNGTDANGQLTYDNDVVDFNYSLNGENSYTLRYGFYGNLEEMQEAANLFKEAYYPHMGESMRPFSVLLFKSLENQEYLGGDFEPVNSVSNIYCMGISLGDIASQPSEVQDSIANEVLKAMVDDTIYDFNWDDYKGPFFEVTGDDGGQSLGELIPGWDRTQLEQLYELGFIDYYEDWTGDMYYDSPVCSWDDMFDLVWATPWDELVAQWGQYTKIMQQLEIVRSAIQATGYIF